MLKEQSSLSLPSGIKSIVSQLVSLDLLVHLSKVLLSARSLRVHFPEYLQLYNCMTPSLKGNMLCLGSPVITVTKSSSLHLQQLSQRCSTECTQASV